MARPKDSLGGWLKVKKWKIAISLAIIASCAAPFATGTWKSRPTNDSWVALTAAEREDHKSYVERTNNCQKQRAKVFQTQELGMKPSINDIADKIYCETMMDEWSAGGKIESTPAPFKYLGLNILTMGALFLFVFSFAMTAPLVIQRYWNWLKK